MPKPIKKELPLHQKQIDCIKNFIKSFHLKDGYLIPKDYSEFKKLDECLLTSIKLSEHFEKYQLGSFIRNLAWSLLKTHKNIDERKKRFELDSWLDSCVKTITQTLNSIPIEYLGSISLPALTTLFPVNVKINSQIALSTVAETTKYGGLLTALMRSEGYSYSQTELIPNTTYINITINGYSDGDINATASVEFLSSLKQFLALALILNLLTADKYQLELLTNIKIENSDRATTPHWVIKPVKLDLLDSMHMEVPPELGAFINILSLNSRNLTFLKDNPKSKTLLGSVIEASPENESEFGEALVRKFEQLSKFFSLPDSFDKKRICAALEWYLDAKSTKNQSTSLIYFCIGLEAILSDDSKSRELQLKDKLSDRVAYIIGKTQSQRVDWKRGFVEIYEARSELVHAKKSRLSKHNTDLLFKADVMLEILISRELNGLIDSYKKKLT